MARRRRRSSAPWKPLLVLALVVATGYAAWRFVPRDLWGRHATPSSASTPLTLPPLPNANAPLDVCALVDREALGAALGASDVEARHVGAAADVPAAGACTWSFSHDGKPGSLVAQVFTRGSLSHGGSADLFGAKYYRSVIVGLEYAYKEPPVMLTGIADEAAAAGFHSGGAEAQLVLRRGDAVANLVVKGADRAAAERAARLLAPKI